MSLFGERIAMREQADEREDGILALESICPDCGKDLPATWHWDGCTRAPVREVRRTKESFALRKLLIALAHLTI